MQNIKIHFCIYTEAKEAKTFKRALYFTQERDGTPKIYLLHIICLKCQHKS